jgi:hypothetical protein
VVVVVLVQWRWDLRHRHHLGRSRQAATRWSEARQREQWPSVRFLKSSSHCDDHRYVVATPVRQLSFSSKLCGVLPGSLGWGWEQAPSWYSALPGPRLSRKWYLVARHGGVDLLGTRMERRCDNVRFARCWCRKLQVLRFAWSWRGEKYFLEREFPRDAADGVLLPILPFFQGALLLGGGELL